MKEGTLTMTRRGFIGAGGAALVGSRILNAGQDEVCDVVVVGTGFAGLTAAIEARNSGAKVLVIEKMPVYGGNSIVNGGDFAAPGNSLQKQAGIEDSPESMLSDMLKAGGGLNHPELARIVAERANETLEWAKTYVGAEFSYLVYHGGHSVKRSVQTISHSGSELVNKLLAKAKKLGVKIALRTKLTRILTGPGGRVVGIEVRRDYKWPHEDSGVVSVIKARKAVVLAAGGFSCDTALRQMHDPRLTSAFESTNHPGATGEALLAACRAGALTVHMDWIQLGPWTSPDEPGFGFTPQICERIVGYGLMVDPETGKRFFKETGNRKERADAIIALAHPVVMLGDSVAVGSQAPAERLRQAIDIGAVKRFESLQDLAAFYRMPERQFLDEVSRWNTFVENKKDLDYGCTIFPDARPTVQAPFYGMRLWPRVHHTMGGLAINARAQVIGFDMKPVPRLYAAGEITGGVHGAVRLGSVAMADCVVFGRIAGRNAAQEKTV